VGSITHNNNEDDAIVDAMNRYTTKLQTPLNAITSED
jgi:hypothetical protein